MNTLLNIPGIALDSLYKCGHFASRCSRRSEREKPLTPSEGFGYLQVSNNRPLALVGGTVPCGGRF